MEPLLLLFFFVVTCHLNSFSSYFTQQPGKKKKDSKFWKDQLKKGATQFRIGSIWDEPTPVDSEAANSEISEDVR